MGGKEVLRVWAVWACPSKRYDAVMRNEFRAIVEVDGRWYVANFAEVPGANGQGATRKQSLAELREATELILEHRREESLRSLPPEAKHELVIVGQGGPGRIGVPCNDICGAMGVWSEGKEKNMPSAPTNWSCGSSAASRRDCEYANQTDLPTTFHS